jgi:guanine nucleotide-binding protein G(i) subunit alpha
MGCVTSQQQQYKNNVNDEEKIRNKEIDTQIKRDKVNLMSQIKLLLLGNYAQDIVIKHIYRYFTSNMKGSEASGKSTVLKQMKLIHEGGYTKEERDAFKEIINSNTVQSMRVILEAMEDMEIPLGPAMEKYKQIIYGLPIQIETDTLPSEATQAIKLLWKEPQVLKVYDRSQEYQLNDSAK